MTNRTVAMAITIASFACASAWAQADDTGKAPSQEVSEGEGVVTRGEGLSRRVTNLLGEARRESDIIRITCLGDKLTQVNAVLSNAQSRLKTLKASVDAGERRHSQTVLQVLGQKLQVLDQEAAQCVGQAMFETGTTKVQTDIDPASVPFEDVRADSPPSMSPAVSPGEVDNNVTISTPVSPIG